MRQKVTVKDDAARIAELLAELQDSARLHAADPSSKYRTTQLAINAVEFSTYIQRIRSRKTKENA